MLALYGDNATTTAPALSAEGGPMPKCWPVMVSRSRQARLVSAAPAAQSHFSPPCAVSDGAAHELQPVAKLLEQVSAVQRESATASSRNRWWRSWLTCSAFSKPPV